MDRIDRIFLTASAVLVLLVGCLPTFEDECVADRDCPVGDAQCRAGVCVAPAQQDEGVLDGETTPPDAALPDAVLPDAALPDAVLPDAALPDAVLPDAALPDAAPTDADLPDADLPDAEVPDASPPCEEDPSFGADCETGVPGVCAIGTMECEGGELACVPATEPTPEVCDGRDNNCDGVTDEGFDLQSDPSHCGACGRTCVFENAVPSCQDGTCEIETCADGYVDLDSQPDNGCEYACTPTQEGETCGDEIDNDCDGSVDEECACDPNAFQPAPCNAQGEIGACRNGTSRCQNGNGSRVVCEPSQPQDEVCDGIDNNCDGSVDEGMRNACGACGEVPNEICDSQDNNCDEQIDEGFDLGTACSVGRGACRDTGIRVCNAGGDGVVCDASEGQPEEEVCDGADNDCDGIVDNGVSPPANQACLCGEGEIQLLGTFECRGAAGWECICECTPIPEVCNGQDDDCDGRIDDGFDLQNDPANCDRCGNRCPERDNSSPICNSGNCSFSCMPGFTDRNDEPADGCESNCVPNGPEVCDGIDNNCNGQVDEDLGGGACQTGEIGPCASGTLSCSRGNMVCVRDTAPSLEVCDGVDNDCDGETDQDDPDYRSGSDCQTDLLGACAVGSVSCVDGVETCESREPTLETCDGVDNDCDGIVDNVDGSGEICFSGGIGACRGEGQMVCGSDGVLVCDAMANQPGLELCNEIDDDCDGSVDEGDACLCVTEAIDQEGACLPLPGPCGAVFTNRDQPESPQTSVRWEYFPSGLLEVETNFDPDGQVSNVTVWSWEELPNHTWVGTGSINEGGGPPDKRIVRSYQGLETARRAAGRWYTDQTFWQNPEGIGPPALVIRRNYLSSPGGEYDEFQGGVLAERWRDTNLEGADSPVARILSATVGVNTQISVSVDRAGNLVTEETRSNIKTYTHTCP